MEIRELGTLSVQPKITAKPQSDVSFSAKLENVQENKLSKPKIVRNSTNYPSNLNNQNSQNEQKINTKTHSESANPSRKADESFITGNNISKDIVAKNITENSVNEQELDIQEGSIAIEEPAESTLLPNLIIAENKSSSEMDAKSETEIDVHLDEEIKTDESSVTNSLVNETLNYMVSANTVFTDNKQDVEPSQFSEKEEMPVVEITEYTVSDDVLVLRGNAKNLVFEESGFFVNDGNHEAEELLKPSLASTEEIESITREIEKIEVQKFSTLMEKVTEKLNPVKKNAKIDVDQMLSKVFEKFDVTAASVTESPVSDVRVEFVNMARQSPRADFSIVNQVVESIKANPITPGNTMNIKLSPEHLGELDLKVTVHKEVVTAEIKVENQVVRAAIESSLADLKQNLNEKGFDVSSISVDIGKGETAEKQFEGNFSRGQRQIVEIAEEEVSEYLEEESTVSYYI